VQVGQQGQYLYVVKPDLTVEFRRITAGSRLGEETVVESGVEAGEKLVTTGQLRLEQGSRVQIQSETGHSLAGAP